MSRRVLAAGVGASLAAVVLAVSLVLLPYRPTGLLPSLAILVLLIPWAAGSGTRAGLGAGHEDDASTAGRLAALTAPVMVLMIVFVANLLWGTTSLGAQQIGSLVLGISAAAMFAARFSGDLAQQEENRREP